IFISIMINLPGEGFGQNIIRTNPADVMDSRALFINPAILPYRDMSFALGMKVFHLGFLSDNSTGLKYSYSSNSFPNLLLDRIGVGVTLESFNTPYFNTAGLGLAFAYSITPGFSFGVSAHGSNLSYDVSKFDLVDPNDPIFRNGAGQWNVRFDAGLLVRPMNNFAVGLSCNNLNRPDLSLINDGAKIPIELNFGIKQYFKIFGASFFGHYENEDLTLGFLCEANIQNKGLLRTGYCDRSLMVEGQLNVGSGFALNYRMDYPLYEVSSFSNGSHELGITWNMRPNPEYSSSVRASADTVRLIRETSKIRINKQENQQQIFDQIDDYDLEFSGAQKNEIQDIPTVASSGMSLDDVFNESLPFSKYLDTYRQNFQEISNNIKETSQPLKVDIYFLDATTAERAVMIKNYFLDTLKFKDKDVRLHQESNSNGNHSSRKDSISSLIKDSPDWSSPKEYIEISSAPIEKLVPNKIVFDINAPNIGRVTKWRILITNILGEQIHEIVGYQNIAREVTWDGFKRDGSIVPVGNYFYQFQYIIGGGDRWFPKKPDIHQIVFIQVRRSKIIEFKTSELTHINKLKEVIIRLKNPAESENAQIP
ncbi:MAG TPA: type IX secretion system membrane protein PorP/SprF, partial [bacterium]